ncbi:MAG: phenylacetate--CoA ligase family protein [Parvibaculaceae bacterium]
MERRLHHPAVETSSREAVLAGQFATLKRLLAKAWAENEFYRDKWRAAGVVLDKIRTLADFTAMVPTVEKQDFVEDQAMAPPFGRRHRHALSLNVPMIITNTSGTSGQGVEIHSQTAQEFKTTEHIYGYLMRWSGLVPSDRVFLTLPVTMMTGGRCEYHGAVGNGQTVFAVGNYDAPRKIELMRRYRPKALFGTTSYFGHLAALCPDPATLGTEVLLTGGEGAGFSWFERLEEMWGARIYDRYGSTQSRNDHMFSCEAGIGSRDRPGMLHNIDSLVLFEVVDPQTGKHVADGEMGEIVITSLYHTDTPLIRCRMRDRGIYREHRYCSCGRPFAGIEAASIGRLDDMRKVKGVNIWPQAVDGALFADQTLDEYQVVLTSDRNQADVATLRVAPKRILSDEEMEGYRRGLAERMRDTTGIQFVVEILAPGTIGRSEYKAKRWIDERSHAKRA